MLRRSKTLQVLGIGAFAGLFVMAGCSTTQQADIKVIAQQAATDAVCVGKAVAAKCGPGVAYELPGLLTAAQSGTASIVTAASADVAATDACIIGELPTANAACGVTEANILAAATLIVHGPTAAPTPAAAPSASVIKPQAMNGDTTITLAGNIGDSDFVRTIPSCQEFANGKWQDVQCDPLIKPLMERDDYSEFGVHEVKAWDGREWHMTKVCGMVVNGMWTDPGTMPCSGSAS